MPGELKYWADGSPAALFETTGGLVYWEDGSAYAQEGGAAGPTTHATTGVLAGVGAVIAGSANRFTAHGTIGALAGPGATVAGTAARTRAHATSGTLTGQGSTLAGSANRFRAHATSGTLAGPGSAVVGAAQHNTTHPTSGTLTGGGAVVAGAAARSAGPVTHDASGALVGGSAVIDGLAQLIAVAVTHTASGSLAGPGAAVAGASSNLTPIIFGVNFPSLSVDLIMSNKHEVETDHDEVVAETGGAIRWVINGFNYTFPCALSSVSRSLNIEPGGKQQLFDYRVSVRGDQCVDELGADNIPAEGTNVTMLGPQFGPVEKAGRITGRSRDSFGALIIFEIETRNL